MSLISISAIVAVALWVIAYAWYFNRRRILKWKHIRRERREAQRPR